MKTRGMHLALIFVFSVLCMMFFVGCACEKCAKKQESKSQFIVPTKQESKPVSGEQKGEKTLSVSPQSKPSEQKAATNTDEGAWEPMFDGHTLYGWKEIDYPGKGEVTVKDGQIILGMGYMTGIKWTNEPPRMNYEVEYEAMRVDSTDFFGSLTFLVNTNPCTFILGGWGGGTVGISSLDDMDASENETSKFMNFENGKWYKVRVRVTEEKIQVWINNAKIIDVVHKGRKVSLRPGDIELSAPFGFSTWSTTGALRNIRIRKVSGPE